jgi:hypothetical protein
MINKQLTSLVKSLSKSEKRYFKVNASVVKTNKTLVRMFDIIEKNNFSSIDLILKELGVKNKKNLAVIESRLQALILRHLRGYNANTSQEIELHNLLIEIEILYNKRLFKNCAKIILKAKKIAITHENHLALLHILKWESYIEKEEGKYLVHSQESLSKILKDEQELLANYSRLVEYKRHTFNFLLLSKNRMIAQLNKEIKTYDKLITNSYFNVDKHHSFEEKLFLLNFKGMYFLSKSNLKEALNQYEILIKEIESSKRKNILRSQEYFLGLNNLLLLQVMNKNFENYNDTLKKIYTQFNKYNEYQPLLFNVTQCYELGIYCEIGAYKKGIKIIPEIEANLKKYQSETNQINKLLFYLNIAIIYFFDENYSKSIYWLNVFLNDYSIKKNDVTSNIYYYGHIINILVHYEAKNYDSIEYLYNQCVGNLKKIRKISRFDKAVLLFIKTNADNPNIRKKEMNRLFDELKSNLTKIIEEPSEKVSLQFFDFFAWIDSHLEDKKIAELIEGKKL